MQDQDQDQPGFGLGLTFAHNYFYTCYTVVS